jgi:phosphonate dehydrogenase
MKPKAVLSHWVHPEVIEFLSGTCEVVANESRGTWSRDEVLRRAQDAQAFMAFMPDCVDAAFLDACPQLKVVGAALKGYDNLDADACERRGVWLTIVPDLLTIPTAELTHGLMIALARNMLPSDRYLRSGQFQGWEPRFYGQSIDGSTVGIVGMGAVGQALAKRLIGYDADVVYFDRKPLSAGQDEALRVRPVELHELLAVSDFVVSILPLNQATVHLINRDALASMKPGSYLINTGRGSTVDEVAVAQALETGRLKGYAADVFEFEDWARGDRPREIPGALLTQPDKTCFTTHIGSAVERVRFEIAMEAAVNIAQALRGEKPKGAVNSPEASVPGG